MNNEIRELEPAEIELISGGNAWLVAGFFIGAMAGAHGLGKDMAMRDNSMQCLAP